MRTIYQVDANRVFTGQFREIGPKEGHAKGWITASTSPPDGVARWTGQGWEALAAYPLPVITKAKLSADLAAHRYEREIGGLSLPNGMEVRTDRETRASITEAVNALGAGLMAAPIPWKLATGWVDLSAADLSGIAAAVAAHVQACFAAERAVQVQIDAAGDLTAFDVPTTFAAALLGGNGE